MATDPANKHGGVKLPIGMDLLIASLADKWMSYCHAYTLYHSLPQLMLFKCAGLAHSSLSKLHNHLFLKNLKCVLFFLLLLQELKAAYLTLLSVFLTTTL